MEAVPGGSVSVTPADTVCVGDTITWTVSGVTDTGGVKRVECTAKTEDPAVPVTYTWVITKPDEATVSGSGTTAQIVTDAPGAFSCTFTAKANRFCPPPELTLTSSKSAEGGATLTLTTSVIAPTTAWPGMPAGLIHL